MVLPATQPVLTGWARRAGSLASALPGGVRTWAGGVWENVSVSHLVVPVPLGKGGDDMQEKVPEAFPSKADRKMNENAGGR